MKIGSLFSGYGGLDLAALQLFPGSSVAWHCEWDKAPSRILDHHWPGVPNLHDVTAVDWDSIEPVDILTGGYPCQPFSAAGRRKGTTDERHLWPYVREAIRRVRPRFALLENVAGHRSLGFDRVLGDMAEDGRDVRWTSVRASDVGACHRRERLFILVTDPSAVTRSDGLIRRAERDGLQEEPCVETSRGDDADRRDLGDHWSHRPANADVVALLPTPSTADGMGGHLTRSGTRSGELLLPGVAKAYGEGAFLPTPRVTTGGSIASGTRLQQVLDGTVSEHADARIELTIEAIARGKYLPTPAASDATGGGTDPERRAARGHAVQLIDQVLMTAWGPYEAAIQRQERFSRPAPSPTEPNSKGNPRLAAEFAEWMMMLPADHVTDPAIGLSRNDQLKAIGNGVCPPQAVAAYSELLSWRVAA